MFLWGKRQRRCNNCRNILNHNEDNYCSICEEARQKVEEESVKFANDVIAAYRAGYIDPYTYLAYRKIRGNRYHTQPAGPIGIDVNEGVKKYRERYNPG